MTSAAASLDLRGGHLVVDFANTVAWRGDSRRRCDYLVTYGDLLAWAGHVEVLSAAELRTLRKAAAENPVAAARVLRRAHRLREALHAIWTSGRPVQDATIIAAAYRSALRNRRLRITDDAVTWVQPTLTIDTPLQRLAIDSVGLLTSVAPTRIKQCQDVECGWLFIDTSHRLNRRWCKAEDCGNRARARRHYARTRGQRDSSDQARTALSG